MSLLSPQKAHHDVPEYREELLHLEQFPLLDSEHALKHCGKHSILIELLTLMTSQELPTDLEQIKNAYQRQNFAEVGKIAHRIKGGAAYVGTIRMKYACQYLECYWKSGKRALLEELYQQAIKTIEDTQIHLKHVLEKGYLG